MGERVGGREVTSLGSGMVSFDVEFRTVVVDSFELTCRSPRPTGRPPRRCAGSSSAMGKFFAKVTSARDDVEERCDPILVWLVRMDGSELPDDAAESWCCSLTGDGKEEESLPEYEL